MGTPMEVGVVGKPNVGKSTLFSALTLHDVAIAPYPFTTTKPNRGIAAVRFPCPAEARGWTCSPGNAKCLDGTRWVPIALIDVPGLVPGAHQGRGLGYEFLDDLRTASGFIHVVDAAGATDREGVPSAPGTSDPADDVRWLEEEMVEWVSGILVRDFERHARSLELEGGKLEELLVSRLTGLSIPASAVMAALRAVPLDRAHPSRWAASERRELARELLRTAKPTLVAANKADRTTQETVDATVRKLSPVPVVPTSAEFELLLRRANRAGLVGYTPGASRFTIPDESRLSAGQNQALDGVRKHLTTWGTTGVQAALESMVFERLHYMIVFPVEDETNWTDSKGRVLPDAILAPVGTPAQALAHRVHSDLGQNFIRAIDGRTHRALGAEHPLEPGSVVRIVAHR